MRRLGLGLALSWVIALVCLPSSARAFTLSNCRSVIVSSHQPSGQMIDWVSGPAETSFASEPFEVEWDGDLQFTFDTRPLVLTPLSWHAEVFGIPMARGVEANDQGDRQIMTSYRVADAAPFRFTGEYFVSGAITGPDGTCEAGAWIKLSGNPAGTVPFYVGLAGVAAGVALFFAGRTKMRRVRVATALLGGVLLGASVGILAVIYSFVPFETWMPAGMVLLGAGIGGASLLVDDWLRRRKPAPRPVRRGSRRAA